jgi:hypothetical protein
MQYTLTNHQLDVMRSALGWNRTPDLAKLGWRNYYCAGYVDGDLEALVKQGLMGSDGRMTYWVTREGARVLGMTEGQIKKLIRVLKPSSLVERTR